MASNLIKISNEEIELEIDLANGARVSSLKWHGYQFALAKRDDPMSWGWFAMVPWAGRIKNGIIYKRDGTPIQLPTHWDPPHAEHGYGFHSEWREIGIDTFELQLPAPYAPAVARQQFTLAGNSFTWSLEYIANGCTLPAWVGFHPWFPRDIGADDELTLEFHAGKMLVRGSDYIPTGEFSPMKQEPWDDAFTNVEGAPVIRWGNHAQIEIASDVPWWVVYNEDPLGICVEPQTAPPDAANLKIDGVHSIRTTFTFS